MSVLYTPFSLIFKDLFYFVFIMCISMYVVRGNVVCVDVDSVSRGQNRALDSLELEF